jgi:hypothetical protein
MYEFDMKGEGERVLLDNGWHLFYVSSMVPETSKQGNEMFVVTLEQPETGAVEPVYMITTRKKRWLLKSFLSACGVVPDGNGIFKFDPVQCVGMSVMGRNSQEPNEYTNRDGEPVKEMRNKIVEFKETEEKATI